MRRAATVNGEIPALAEGQTDETEEGQACAVRALWNLFNTNSNPSPELNELLKHIPRCKKAWLFKDQDYDNASEWGWSWCGMFGWGTYSDNLDEPGGANENAFSAWDNRGGFNDTDVCIKSMIGEYAIHDPITPP
jgi:hypothetical protein